MGQKYGTRRWDAATRSQIIRCDIDEAGRRRGFLLPQASAPTEARKSSAAAWNEPRGPIDFGDPTRPLSQAERNYILDAFDGAPGSSQFKFKVLRHLGAHAQDAAFALVEAMLRSGLVSHLLKKGLAHLDSKTKRRPPRPQSPRGAFKSCRSDADTEAGSDHPLSPAGARLSFVECRIPKGPRGQPCS